MKNYQKILLAVELIPESDIYIINRAITIANSFHSELVIAHAIEHYPYVYGSTVAMDVEKEMFANARVMMANLQKQFPDNSVIQTIVTPGSAKHVIVDESKKHNVDLIILGSHGKHGMRLLLGSTANAVLHAAHCDVLAVRMVVKK